MQTERNCCRTQRAPAPLIWACPEGKQGSSYKTIYLLRSEWTEESRQTANHTSMDTEARTCRRRSYYGGDLQICLKLTKMEKFCSAAHFLPKTR